MWSHSQQHTRSAGETDFGGLLGRDAIARDVRKLAFRPAEYAHPTWLPTGLPIDLMASLARSPRTRRLVSVCMQPSSGVRPDGWDGVAACDALALLDGEALELLARMIGVALLHQDIRKCIAGELLRSTSEQLGASLIGFARSSAAIIVGSHTATFALGANDLSSAVDGAGYRMVAGALAEAPHWLQDRIRIKLPKAIDQRIAIDHIPRDAMRAIALRTARHLPKPWSTSFVPKRG